MKIWRLAIIVFCLLSITSVHGMHRHYLILAATPEAAQLPNTPYHIIGAVVIDDLYQIMTITLLVQGGEVTIHMDMNAEGTGVDVSVTNPQGALTVASSQFNVSGSFIQAVLDAMGLPSTWLTVTGTTNHFVPLPSIIQPAQRVLYDRGVTNSIDGVQVSFVSHLAATAMNARYRTGSLALNPGQRTNGRTRSVTPLNDGDLQRLLSLFIVAFLTPQLHEGRFSPPAQDLLGHPRPAPLIIETGTWVYPESNRQPADRQRVQVPAAHQVAPGGGPSYPVGGLNVCWQYYPGRQYHDYPGRQYHAWQQAGAVVMDPTMAALQQQLQGMPFFGGPPLYCRGGTPPWSRHDRDQGPDGDHGFGGGAMQHSMQHSMQH